MKDFSDFPFDEVSPQTHEDYWNRLMESELLYEKMEEVSKFGKYALGSMAVLGTIFTGREPGIASISITAGTYLSAVAAHKLQHFATDRKIQAEFNRVSFERAESRDLGMNEGPIEE